MPPSPPLGASASTALARPMPHPPAQVQPCVDAPGADLAATFLLTCGGAEISLSASPRRAAHATLIGPDCAAALAERADCLPRRVPLANRWLARMLAWQGASAAGIARRLRTSDSTVRACLRDGRVR